jgi:SRSO17 transposase
MTPADLRQALPLFDDFARRFAPLLGDDSRADRARAYLRGLLLDHDDNKTAEAIAPKVHGDPSQVRMTQVFLSQSPWPDAPLRQELGHWVAPELGHADGVLIFDESSFPTCGTKSVGVARQYCGALGKVANCQVAVYVAYASGAGHTLLDTRLYLPDAWADDPARCRAAGVPEGTVFRTKPALAFELLLAWRDQPRHSWVTFDEVYGRDPDFVSGLEELGERYVGEVPKDTRVWLKRPAVQPPGPGGRGAPRRKPRVAPGAPPRRRWRRSPGRCRRRRGSGGPSGRGGKGCSTPTSPACASWWGATACRARSRGCCWNAVVTSSRRRSTT